MPSLPLERARRIRERLDRLALCTEEPGRITRPYGSRSLGDAYALVNAWLAAAGLRTWADAIGNLRASTARGRPRRLLLGSHLDSVRDAGRFDGPLGVLIAVDLAENHRAALSSPWPFDLDIAGFCDEEGLRFHSTYLGSRALAGVLDPVVLAETRDADGITLGEAVRRFVGESAPPAALPRDGLLGYVEVHIEQGPVLEARATPLGVVSGIAGQARVAWEFTGRAAHAGTTPMALRADALVAAARWVAELHDFARHRSAEGLVATVGRLEVTPGASNVVPGRATGTLDLRAPMDRTRHEAAMEILALGEVHAANQGCEFSARVEQETPAARCDLGLRGRLLTAVRAAGLPTAVELPSGAGHDAAALAAAGIPSAMLFVRCRGGVSHHPDEYCSEEDIAAALAAMDEFLLALAVESRPKNGATGKIPDLAGLRSTTS